MNENEDYEITIDLEKWHPTEQDISTITKDIKSNIQCNTEIQEPTDELEELLKAVQNKPFDIDTKAKIQTFYKDYIETVEYDMMKRLFNKAEFDFVCYVLGITEITEEIEDENND